MTESSRLDSLQECGLNRLMEDFSLMCDKRATRQLVVQIEMNSSFFDKMRKEVRDGPCVHLAGVERHRAREVRRSDNGDAVPHHHLARFGESAVPSLLGR